MKLFACTFCAFWTVMGAMAQPKKLTVSWKEETRAKSGWYKATIRFPQFSGGSMVARAANSNIASASRKARQVFISDVIEGGKPRYQNELALSYDVGLASRGLVSVMATTFADNAGAHPNTFYKGSTFGIVQGVAKQLKIDDLLSLAKGSKMILQAMILERLKSMEAQWVLDGTVKELNAANWNSFLVTPGGMTWIFQPYEMGPYAQGEFTVKFLWADIGKVLNPNGPLKGLLPSPIR